MTELAGEVAAVLERSVRPAVIARGGAVRVTGVKDGVVTLEMTGSPGAVLPLASRIEALIRAAVPGVAAVRLVTPAPDPRERRRKPLRASPKRLAASWTPRSTRRSPPTAAMWPSPTSRTAGSASVSRADARAAAWRK